MFIVYTFDFFLQVRNELKALLTEVECNLCHRLAQLHSINETPNQKALKRQIKDNRQKAENRLQSDFDFSKVGHSEWSSKIVKKEHRLFLGLVSVAALAHDTIIDADQMLDEYLSGFTDNKF